MSYKDTKKGSRGETLAHNPTRVIVCYNLKRIIGCIAKIRNWDEILNVLSENLVSFSEALACITKFCIRERTDLFNAEVERGAQKNVYTELPSVGCSVYT